MKPNIKMVGEVFDALRAAAQLGASIEPPAWLDGAYRQPPHTLVACANALIVRTSPGSISMARLYAAIASFGRFIWS